ncbi:MAG: hypothetical protein ACFFDT_10200 [Candidatus Hodarchaeota archaeon]
MLNRSILTAIIGFLVGCLFYYVADAGVVVVLIMGVSGYFFGFFLDNADVKHQLDHFSPLSSSEEIFQSADLPEAHILFSKKENLTTVSIDFQVETKPQTFRLSVLKNLQDHQFRILEDSNKTIFSLTLDFPEINYPKIIDSPDLKKEFHFNIRERSLDFQNAVQKIVPGLVLSKFVSLDFLGDELLQGYSGQTFPRPSQLPPPSSTSNSSNGRPEDDYESEFSRSSQATTFEERQIMSESQIMEDLLPGSSTEPKLPDLSPNEVQQLRDSNQRQLEIFLNDDGEIDKSNDIKIDFSKVDQPGDNTIEDFNQSIIKRIEERTNLALNKPTPDLELQKESEEIKKYIDDASKEESTS